MRPFCGFEGGSSLLEGELMRVHSPPHQMPIPRRLPRIDLVEVKSRILRKLGFKRSEKYFCYLKLLLSLKITKSEFNKLCFSVIGPENVALHNSFIRSIIRNACIAASPPTSSTKSINSRDVNQTRLSMIYGDDVFPKSPQKGRSTHVRSCRFKERPSPLRPLGQISRAELYGMGFKSPENGLTVIGSCDVRKAFEHQSEVFSVEDGEEVEQMAYTPYVQSRSPLTAPLGIQLGPYSANRTSKSCQSKLCVPQTCSTRLELPDSASLKQRLESVVQREGLEISNECVNLINHGLNSFLRKLINPCLELARARRTQDQLVCCSRPGKYYMQKSDNGTSVSLLDFRTAVQLNPQLLGCDWPSLIERYAYSGQMN